MSEYIINKGMKLIYEIDGEGGMYITVPDEAERIVRCKDCKYYEYLRNIDFHNCDRQCPCVKPDGFCAWGEQKNQ